MALTKQQKILVGVATIGGVGTTVAVLLNQPRLPGPKWTVEFNIIDSITHAPLKDVIIFLDRYSPHIPPRKPPFLYPIFPPIKVSTGPDGKAIIANFREGTYRITIHKSGYETLRDVVYYLGDTYGTVPLELRPAIPVL